MSRVVTAVCCWLVILTTPAAAQTEAGTIDQLQIAATPSGVLSTGEPGSVPLPRRGKPARSDWEDDDPHPAPPPQNNHVQPHPRSAVKQPIQHSKMLPPVDPRLAPGRVFDPSLLPAHPVEADWYRIPEWLAGQWQKKSETILQEGDYRSGEMITSPSVSRRRQSMAFGTVLDKAGHIWHLVKLPIVRKFRMENRVEYKVEVALAFPSLPMDQVYSTARTIVVQVENDTNLIVQTRQEEGIWHMSPISDRNVRCLGSMKSFDMNGVPVGICRAAVKLHRVKPLEIAAGQDLRASLAKYLSGHGMGTLAPLP